jgi:hypothetical protein
LQQFQALEQQVYWLAADASNSRLEIADTLHRFVTYSPQEGMSI